MNPILKLLLLGLFPMLGTLHAVPVEKPSSGRAPDARAQQLVEGLTLKAPIDLWDEAIPLGNGIVGGLLWGGGNELRLSLDRGDLWDTRPNPLYLRSDFNYATLVEHVQSGTYEDMRKRLTSRNPAEPALRAPTKLPGARLVVTLAPDFCAQSFGLDFKRALGTVNFGAAQAECFFSEASGVALLLLPDAAPKFDLVPNQAVKKLGYKTASVARGAGVVTLTQAAAEGLRYVVHVASRPAKGGTLLVIAIATNRDGDPESLAKEQVLRALDTGYETVKARHEQWWDNFWSKSSISIPDAKLLQHYNLVQYFYGAASRRGAPPIPLQGLWTADEGNLPPWAGDYHHDLNTELTYWAYPTAGHFDEGRSYLDFMWSLKPKHEQFARDFFGLKHGFIVPGVMALDGRAMGANFAYVLSPTMGAWVAQAFYVHWRYEMDHDFLAERAYPYCSGVGEALAELLKPDPLTGKLKLPTSTTPETRSSKNSNFFTPNSNCDLALLAWLFTANGEMAVALGKTTDAERWQALRAQLDPFAVTESGVLMLAPGETITHNDRHHSPLMAIHPLGLIHPENGAHDRRIVDATFAAFDRLGTSHWTGFSFSWMAAMRARTGRGDEALRLLSDYLTHFITRNGFHVNGVLTDSKISNYRRRAFTLEGNFAAAQAVHEMLLQSWGGRVRVFPAIPAAWRDVSFRDLRAEGGFLVSAERHEGRVQHVAIRAIVEQDLRLVDPFSDRAFDHNLAVKRSAGEIRCRLRPGQVLELNEK